MPLTAPSYLLEASILTKHRTLKAEDLKISKQETSSTVSDLDKSSLSFKIDGSKLLKSDSDRPGPVELRASHLLCSSNLLMSSLTTYQQSALVSLKSSLLESQTKNLVEIPVKSLSDKNTRSANFQSSISPECLNNRTNTMSSRQCNIPKASENVRRHKEKVDHRRDKSSCRRRGKSSESKKKGTLQKRRLDKEETEADATPSYLADKGIPDYNFKPDFKPEVVDLPAFLPPDKDQDILKSTILAERLGERDRCLILPKVCFFFLNTILKEL